MVIPSFAMDLGTNEMKGIMYMIILVFVAGIALFLFIRWNRKRLKRLKAGLSTVTSDRTSNEINQVKGIERMMVGKGFDTSSARPHIKSATELMRSGDSVGASEHAIIAKSILMDLKEKKDSKELKTMDLLSMPEVSEKEEKEDTSDQSIPKMS